QLSKVYEGRVPYRALTDIQLDIEEGEFVGIMGPSGSGKTTLLNIIATIDEASTGEVTIEGNNPHRLSKNELAKFRRQKLGFVFSEFKLLHTHTVKENIFLPPKFESAKGNGLKIKGEQIAKRLGILGILQKRTFEISGGQAQRVAVARA